MVGENGEVIDTIEPFLKNGEDLLCVTLSSGLSGMYGVFVNAKRDLAEKYRVNNLVEEGPVLKKTRKPNRR